MFEADHHTRRCALILDPQMNDVRWRRVNEESAS
jgi:hypothetical protein